MKKIVSVIVALVLYSGLNAQGIQFEHGTLAEALNKAKAENKMVFMDCYTSWCGPCKALAKNVFPQKEVGDFFNKHFVNVKMDCEKGEGPDVAQKYGVKAYPTMVFINPDGEVVHKLVGGLAATELIDGAKSAITPELSLGFLDKKYAEGNREPEFLLSYLEVLKVSEREKMKPVARELLSKKPLEDFMTKERFFIIGAAEFPVESKEFKYVLSHISTVKEITSPWDYDAMVRRVCYSYLMDYAKECTCLDSLHARFDEYHQLVGLGSEAMVKPQLDQEYFYTNNQMQNWFDSRVEAVNSMGRKQFYNHSILRLCQDIIKDPKLYEDKKIMKQTFALANDLAEADVASGNLLLIRLYIHAENKKKALKHYEICMTQINDNKSNMPVDYLDGLKNQIDSL